MISDGKNTNPNGGSANPNGSGNPSQIYVSESRMDNLFRNMTYRFRFLNGHFDNLYINVSFVILTKKYKNGVIIEVNPK